MDSRIEIGDALNAIMMVDHAILGQRQSASETSQDGKSFEVSNGSISG